MTHFKGGRILYLDDDENLLKILTLQLGKHGHEVLASTSVSEGFKILELERPDGEKSPVDLILLDVQMPEMDGIEACRKIKSVERYKDIPVLMLTSMEDIRSLQMAFSAGAADYIRKPFNKVELLARVQSFLTLRIEIEKRKAREAELLETSQKLEAANHMLENLSAMDHLTGVANRRAFDEHVAEEWRRAMRDNKPLSFLMMDVDYFKYYNDTYGHQAGDQCLIQIANALKSMLKRPGDILARYGGEEFAVVLQNADEVGATQIAEEMRSQVLALNAPHEKSPFKQVSISIGITSIQPSADTPSGKLISQADQALYQAKGKGRNTICIFTEDRFPNGLSLLALKKETSRNQGFH